VLLGVKALRFAPTPHSGAEGLDAHSARARLAFTANARHTTTGTGGLTRRHFYVFRWPLTFRTLAGGMIAVRCADQRRS
jgi:hypothetical protein